MEFPLPAFLCGRSLSEVSDDERFRPVMITRAGQAKLVGPGVVGQEGDLVHFAVRTDALAEITAKLVRTTPAAGHPGAGAGEPAPGQGAGGRTSGEAGALGGGR